ILGHYSTAVARLLRGLALAGQACNKAGDDRAVLLAELDETTRWLAARAADAPDNFLHLLRWLEAERAWAVGGARGAELAFDAARREAPSGPRPGQKAVTTERAPRFPRPRGRAHAGNELLVQARQYYAAWGASAKVDQLDWAFPSLQPHPDVTTASGDQPTA